MNGIAHKYILMPLQIRCIHAIKLQALIVEIEIAKTIPTTKKNIMQ